MTIVEFLHPLKSATIRDMCLGALYYQHRYRDSEALSVDELRSVLRRARVPRAGRINLADTLAKSAPYVHTPGKQGNKFLWALTQTGEQHVRALLGLPKPEVEIEHDVSTLEGIADTIARGDVADYVRESVKCLSVGALRASVVFLWAGVVREIQSRVIKCRTRDINAAVAKYEPKGRTVKKIDDLSCLTESILLLVTQELRVFDKNQRTVLESALDLRNKCGHPGKYLPGPKKASSFIEDVVGIVFA